MRRLILVVSAVASAALLVGCGAYFERAERNDRAQVAKAMFEERCKKAGFFIHRTVKDVEGILVMKVRPNGVNYGAQFLMDDPYGSDLSGNGYLESFLAVESIPRSNIQPRSGFKFVEAVDPRDGVRYRYTGSVRSYVATPIPPFTSVREPFTTIGFVLDKAPAAGTPPRYGVTYDDISTRLEREYWIAGSSLRVVDTQTGEVLAERIGYMWDPGQGNNSGGRSPWLHAARYACPSFYDLHPPGFPRYGPINPIYQTIKFVSHVLEVKH